MRLDDIFPFILGGFALLIPVVAILTAHQQKMAQLLRGDATREQDHKAIADLANEVRALREQMQEQALAIDNLSQKVDSQKSLESRLEPPQNLPR